MMVFVLNPFLVENYYLLKILCSVPCSFIVIVLVFTFVKNFLKCNVVIFHLIGVIKVKCVMLKPYSLSITHFQKSVIYLFLYLFIFCIYVYIYIWLLCIWLLHTFFFQFTSDSFFYLFFPQNWWVPFQNKTHHYKLGGSSNQ